ncbi:RagB/SusD family nutrient uptake outer membrane protein [Flavivirga eckloniae]|nr:RagB/SusD family nutrient uptake outer membrane protein [Flavivirga eckloniae]
MKKYIYNLFLMLIVVLPIVGCDSYLEEELHDTYGEGNFPTEATVETILNTAHSDIGKAVLNANWMHWAVGFPTPSLHYRYRQVHQRNNLSSWTWNTTRTDPAYFDILEFMWDAVRSSNEIIDKVPDIEMKDTKRQAEIIAEAKFIRAMCYFYAVRLWGGMPIIDKPQGLSDDLYPKRATTTETYAFLTKDLKEAIVDLPTRSEYISRGIPLGHITKGAAKGTLAKAYITMAGKPLEDNSNLTEARTLLEEVINSGEYSLVGVGASNPYELLFDWQNDNNEEFLYAIQKEGPSQNYRGIFGYFTPKHATSGIWTSGEGDKFSKGAGLDGVPPEFVDWYASHDSGPRFQWSIVTEYVLQEDINGFNAGEILRYDAGPDAQGHVGKWRARGAELTGNFNNPNNFPVLRYADILLLHSEVTNELDTPDYSGINAVRERAGLPLLGGLSKEDFRDAVFLERDLELTFEHNMLFDMRRRGLEYTKSKLVGFYNPNQNNYPNSFDIQDIEPHRLLFPYPQRDLESNPNLEQNPGYPR